MSYLPRLVPSELGSGAVERLLLETFSGEVDAFVSEEFEADSDCLLLMLLPPAMHVNNQI